MFKKLSRVRVSLALPLVYALTMLACPLTKPVALPEPVIVKVAKASSNIARYTDDGIKIVTALYKGQLLGKTAEENLRVKDLFAKQFQTIATNGIKFQGLLKTYRDQYPDGVVPPSVIALLVTNFEPVTTELLALLQQTNKLTPDVANQIIVGIRVLMAAITVIATSLASQSVTMQRQLKEIQQYAARVPALTSEERNGYGF
jgi:hypothetical protein